MSTQASAPGFWRAWLLGWICGVTVMALMHVITHGW